MHAALALNLDAALLRASVRLLEAGEVEAVEWSFDAPYAVAEAPAWFTDLLGHFAGAGRLYGHGVFFSLFDGRWRPEQEAWLRHLRATVERFDLRHVSEHFGFFSGADFHRGAPLGVPLTARTLALGRDRLARLADAARRPVGLENLALAFGPDDVARQGEFLDALLAPTDGFVILDLHNLYCQADNFGVDAAALLRRYPLHRVRELHLAGGSWVDSDVEPGRRVRRDTHDDRVPAEVWDLLDLALAHCPRAELAVLEHLGAHLGTREQGEGFRADFRRLRDTLRAAEPPAADAPLTPEGPPAAPAVDATPLVDRELYAQQRALVEILATAPEARAAHARLREADLPAWGVDAWDVAMVETAMRIVRKWA